MPHVGQDVFTIGHPKAYLWSFGQGAALRLGAEDKPQLKAGPAAQSNARVRYPACLHILPASLLAAIADQRERRPEDRVRVAEDGLPAHSVDERAMVDEPVHGLL